jgi:hypothetical protein
MPVSLSDAFVLEDWTSQRWRLENLYTIIDKNGSKIRFKPNAEQIDLLFDRMWYRNLVLKARQLGLSTAILLYILDSAAWGENINCGVVADTLDNAEKLFRKIEVAFDAFPLELQQALKLKKRTTSEMYFGNGSSIGVSTSMRGGTINILHVSEFGKICAHDLIKAREIVTGSMEAVPKNGAIFIESTAEGEDGYYYDYVTEALKRVDSKQHLTQMDFRLHFYAWWQNPEYALSDSDTELVTIGAEHLKYFERLQVDYGIHTSQQQRAWYVKKAETAKGDMKREYPSYPREAFEVALEGAIFQTEMAYLRQSNRITNVAWEPKSPVHTHWDLGINDTMSILFYQQVAGQRRYIDYFEDSGRGLGYYIKKIQEKPYIQGTIYLPHDGDSAVQTDRDDPSTYRQMLADLGLRNVQVMARTPNKMQMVNSTRDYLRTLWIDKEKCAMAIKAFDNYQREWDEKRGRWKDQILHNWASHACDALQTGAQAANAATASSLYRPGERQKLPTTGSWKRA